MQAETLILYNHRDEGIYTNTEKYLESKGTERKDSFHTWDDPRV